MLNWQVLEWKKIVEIKEEDTEKGKGKKNTDMIERNEVRNKQKTKKAKEVKEDNDTKEARQNKI